jgi:hypothetical protein
MHRVDMDGFFNKWTINVVNRAPLPSIISLLSCKLSFWSSFFKDNSAVLLSAAEKRSGLLEADGSSRPDFRNAQLSSIEYFSCQPSWLVWDCCWCVICTVCGDGTDWQPFLASREDGGKHFFSKGTAVWRCTVHYRYSWSTRTNKIVTNIAKKYVRKYFPPKIPIWFQ